jgi:cellulose biosynthesis protein BcsQ
VVLPVLSMVDRRRKLHRELVEQLRATWPEVLPTVIPSAAAIERMGVEQAPVAAFAPASPAAAVYRDLWADVAGRLY